MPNQDDFQFLVSVSLATVYEKHFKQKPCEANGEPTKPYLAFVEATLQEMKITNRGKPHTQASIAKAYAKGQRKLLEAMMRGLQRLQAAPWSH